MSVSMTKGEGVTVLTLTSDPQSSWPPICQILKGLCYSPICCSVSQHLKKVQGSSQSVLGAMHIMVGLLHIGLGAILTASSSGSWYMMDESGFPYWMGGLFILFGIVSILSERFPSPCLVILNVFLTLSGVVFAIAAIALYSINVAHIYLWWSCGRSGEHDYYYDNYRHRHNTIPPPTTASPEKIKCLEAKDLVEVLLRSINAVLIILSVLELCLCLSSAILGIKALCKKKENKSPEDLEQIKPLLEEVTSYPSA